MLLDNGDPQDLWREYAASAEDDRVPFARRLGIHALAKLAPTQDSELLNLEAGAGSFAIAASTVVRRVVAVEDWPSEFSKLEARTSKMPNVVLVRAASDALPFRNERFSRAMCAIAGDIRLERGRLFRELRRVLSSDGNAAVVVWSEVHRASEQPSADLGWPRGQLEQAGLRVDDISGISWELESPCIADFERTREAWVRTRLDPRRAEILQRLDGAFAEAGDHDRPVQLRLNAAIYVVSPVHYREAPS